MFRLICLVVVIGLGYLAYDAYGYRYYLNDIQSKADQSMMMGSNNPDIQIVAYIDYDSSASRRLYPVLLNLMASDPNVRLIIRPVEGKSNISRLATRVALAASKQGRFLDVNNTFLTAGVDIDERYVEGIIRSLGLNYARLKSDALSPEVEKQATDLQSEALLLNVHSMPFFFIEHVKMPGASYSVNEIKNIIGDLRTGRR